MVLTKEELISCLQGEVGLLVHLASKVEPAMLDYRPTAKQRSIEEFLQYLALMGPIHLRGTLMPVFDMQEFGNAWKTGQAAVKELDLDGLKEAIAKQSALIPDLLGPCSEADLRTEIEMFGSKASRGAMLVKMVLCHYSAYRMQLFHYLKGAGREELNTMNVWAGIDAPMSQ